MSFWPIELSWHGASPVELYEFAGPASTWRYTSRGKAVSWGGHTWTSEALKREAIRSSREITKEILRVEFPRTNVMAGQLIGYPSDDLIRLTLWRGHATDPDAEFQAYWKGAVASAKGSGSKIILECATGSVGLRRAGLRRRYSKGCPYALYGEECGVDKAGFAVAGTVSAVSGNTLTVAAAASHADGWFDGGMAEVGGYFRMIATHVGSAITLLWPFHSLAIGAAVTLYPGCDRTDATCDTKFSNLLNGGAFRFLSKDTPVGRGSIV